MPTCISTVHQGSRLLGLASGTDAAKPVLLRTVEAMSSRLFMSNTKSDPAQGGSRLKMMLLRKRRTCDRKGGKVRFKHKEIHAEKVVLQSVKELSKCSPPQRRHLRTSCPMPLFSRCFSFPIDHQFGQVQSLQFADLASLGSRLFR